MGNWDIEVPGLGQTFDLSEPDYSRFQDYIPGWVDNAAFSSLFAKLPQVLQTRKLLRLLPIKKPGLLHEVRGDQL